MSKQTSNWHLYVDIHDMIQSNKVSCFVYSVLAMSAHNMILLSGGFWQILTTYVFRILAFLQSMKDGLHESWPNYAPAGKGGLCSYQKNDCPDQINPSKNCHEMYALPNIRH